MFDQHQQNTLSPRQAATSSLVCSSSTRRPSSAHDTLSCSWSGETVWSESTGDTGGVSCCSDGPCATFELLSLFADVGSRTAGPASLFARRVAEAEAGDASSASRSSPGTEPSNSSIGEPFRLEGP